MAAIQFAAVEADQAATTAPDTAVRAETSTARAAPSPPPLSSARSALSTPPTFYLQLHAAHFAPLEAVSEHVEVAKTLLTHLDEFELTKTLSR